MVYVKVVFAALFLTGCVGTSYHVNVRRPAFQGRVLVYDHLIPAAVKYQVVGDFIEQKGFYGGTNETANAARREAASRGANGMLIERSGHRCCTGWAWSSPYTEGKLLWITNYDAAKSALTGSTSTKSNAERLRDLDSLHRQGLVTDAEFEFKRRQLVDGL